MTSAIKPSVWTASSIPRPFYNNIIVVRVVTNARFEIDVDKFLAIFKTEVTRNSSVSIPIGVKRLLWDSQAPRFELVPGFSRSKTYQVHA